MTDADPHPDPHPGSASGPDPHPSPRPRPTPGPHPGPDIAPGPGLDPDLAHEGPVPAGRRSRAALYGVVVVCLLAAVALALSRWLGPTLLDPRSVERDVAEQFQERYDVGVAVDCPSELEVEEGREYRCDAETDDREQLTVVVTVTDEDEPAYTWDVD